MRYVICCAISVVLTHRSNSIVAMINGVATQAASKQKQQPAANHGTATRRCEARDAAVAWV